MDICNIPIYKEIDPFFLELQIIKFQLLWRYNKYHKHKSIIIKNIKLLHNYCDPISLNYFYITTKKTPSLININTLYPIIIKNQVYVYELKSLKELLDIGNIKEIYTNTPLDRNQISNIKFLTKDLNRDNTPLSVSENRYIQKIEVFQIFFELDTYFTLELYENIKKYKLSEVFTELKMLWRAFKEDNRINEIELFGNQIIWTNNKIDNIENILLKNINIMINNKLENNIRKNICYIIIGAFSYVDKDIKKIYNNFEFI
mgnify:CR=1 FL=1|jgi:hypothetical protein